MKIDLKNKTLVLASHNPNKLKELVHRLTPFGVTLKSLSDYGIIPPEETGKTFQENASLKARNASLKTGEWALADDSGLKVTALDEQPGVYSARWAGPTQDYNQAMDRLHAELLKTGSTDWSAAFECCLALSDPQGNVTLFHGEITGTIVIPARGHENFGYDPIFQPVGYTKTFGEMKFFEKQNMPSHRMIALERFLKACF